MSTRPSRTSILTLLIGLLALAALLLVFALFPALLDYLDVVTSDFEIYHFRPMRPSGNVVIAAIDDASIGQFGRWPWPRNIHGKLLKALGEYKVSVVGFDMVFSEPDAARSDSSFARAMAIYAPTYIGYFFSSQMSPSYVSINNYRTSPLNPRLLSYTLVRKAGDQIR